MSSRDYFKGKRIAVIGIGPHGEMSADVRFLIKAGALVSVYDLRSEARLKDYILSLRAAGLASYVCGSIPADDLLDMELVILSSEYSRESSFLKPVMAAKIQIEYPETLFFKLAPPVTFIGVMGACGKATVVSMLTPLLESACDQQKGQGFFTIDPESDDGILAHLKKIKSGDIVLMRVTEPMMKELHDMRISPHVAIFTTVPGRGAYMQSPFDILEFQTYNNFIIANDAIIDATYSYKFQPKGKMLRTKASIIPADWPLNIQGTHNRDNAALALQAAQLFKVSDDDARDILSKWTSLKGRLELVKKVKGIEFYNDTASVSPYSTQAALQTVAQGKNVVLIFGGANTDSDQAPLYSLFPQYVQSLVLLPGSGTLKQREAIQHIEGLSVLSAPSLEEATRMALDHARKGDKVLFSPGFEAGGFDRSRKERGERFVKAVRGL